MMTTATTNNLNQSALSLNSKFTNDLLYDETNDYNELHAPLELCPIVASDLDDDDLDVRQQIKKQKPSRPVVESPPLARNKNMMRDDSVISVKLNNTSLTYQYQKKEDASATHNKSVSVSTITHDEDETVESNTTPSNDNNQRTNRGVGRKKTSKLVIDANNKPPAASEDVVVVIDDTKTFTYRLKNRLSYFSSCSSCDSSSSSPSTADSRLDGDGDDEHSDENDDPYDADNMDEDEDDNDTIDVDNKNGGVPASAIKYHLISVIFILMGLFSLNIVQETYLLYYYFSSEQYYWFTYALVALFTGQVLTLILSLVAEVDSVSTDTATRTRPTSSSILQGAGEQTLVVQCSSSSSTTTTTADVASTACNSGNGDLVRLTNR